MEYIQDRIRLPVWRRTRKYVLPFHFLPVPLGLNLSVSSEYRLLSQRTALALPLRFRYLYLRGATWTGLQLFTVEKSPRWSAPRTKERRPDRYIHLIIAFLFLLPSSSSFSEPYRHYSHCHPYKYLHNLRHNRYHRSCLYFHHIITTRTTAITFVIVVVVIVVIITTTTTAIISIIITTTRTTIIIVIMNILSSSFWNVWPHLLSHVIISIWKSFPTSSVVMSDPLDLDILLCHVICCHVWSSQFRHPALSRYLLSCQILPS